MPKSKSKNSLLLKRGVSFASLSPAQKLGMFFTIALLSVGGLYLYFHASASGGNFSSSDASDQFSRVNGHRVNTHGYSRLTDVSCMDQAASAWAQNMADRRTLYHSRANPSDTSNPNNLDGGWINKYCNGWSSYGENVGVYGSDCSGCIFDMFLQSAEHHANIDNGWSQLGIGAYVDSSGELWVTQSFCNGCQPVQSSGGSGGGGSKVSIPSLPSLQIPSLQIPKLQVPSISAPATINR